MPTFDRQQLASAEGLRRGANIYRDSVLPPAVKSRLAVEAGITLGWSRYVGDYGNVIEIDCFGESAPGPVMMREYGFTVDNICEWAEILLERGKPCLID